MARRVRQDGSDPPPPGRRAGPSGGRNVVKVTLTLSVRTAQRLGVEAAMRLVSKSDVAEEVLSRHLSTSRLPSTAGHHLGGYEGRAGGDHGLEPSANGTGPG